MGVGSNLSFCGNHPDWRYIIESQKGKKHLFVFVAGEVGQADMRKGKKQYTENRNATRTNSSLVLGEKSNSF